MQMQEDPELLERIHRFLWPDIAPTFSTIDSPSSRVSSTALQVLPMFDQLQHRYEFSAFTSAPPVFASPLSTPMHDHVEIGLAEQLWMQDVDTVNRSVADLDPSGALDMHMRTNLSIIPAPQVDSRSLVATSQQLHGPSIGAVVEIGRMSMLPGTDQAMLMPMEADFALPTENQALPAAQLISTGTMLGYPSIDFAGALQHINVAESSLYAIQHIPPIGSGDGQSAFRRFSAQLAARLPRPNVVINSLFKKSLRFWRGYQRISGTPSALRGRSARDNQHMMKERTRRGKQNESFNTLRTLLPTLRKKDKVTVLEHTVNYVKQLQDRVEELERQNKQLQTTIARKQGHVTSGAGVPPQNIVPGVAATAGRAIISTEFGRIQVIYHAPLFHLEIDLTGGGESSTTLINVLTALKQMKLNCVQMQFDSERNSFAAQLSAEDEDAIPTPEEVEEKLRYGV